MENIKQLEQARAALEGNGFVTKQFSCGQEAARCVVQSIPADASVGIGGSVTVQSLGLWELLQQSGHEVFWHWKASPEQTQTQRDAAVHADVYLASSNAVTLQGELVNIDGSGNRVAAQIYGPERVILLCGRNKLCADIPAAVARIKREACPANARRLGLSTPCALTGRCTDCRSPQRMCN
ncbi:MAG: lactate utilization protein, partial [Eubacteriales bacterium]|nr:lactate utilization protein [Eubacteriales bacterium]